MSEWIRWNAQSDANGSLSKHKIGANRRRFVLQQPHLMSATIDSRANYPLLRALSHRHSIQQNLEHHHTVQAIYILFRWIWGNCFLSTSVNNILLCVMTGDDDSCMALTIMFKRLTKCSNHISSSITTICINMNKILGETTDIPSSIRK